MFWITRIKNSSDVKNVNHVGQKKCGKALNSSSSLIMCDVGTEWTPWLKILKLAQSKKRPGLASNYSLLHMILTSRKDKKEIFLAFLIYFLKYLIPLIGTILVIVT
jgi:hypothetical protein